MTSLKNRNGAKLTLLLASSLTIMSAATIAPSLPQMAVVFQKIQNVEFLTKLILTIPTLFIAIVAPLVGRFIDRYGRIRLLLIGLILYGLAGTSGFYLNNLYYILISRAILGVAVGIVMTISVTLAGDYFEGLERQKFIGLQVAFVSFGGVLFIATSGVLADFSWQAPFLIYGFSFLVIPLVLFYLIEPKAIILPKTETPLGDEKWVSLIFGTTILTWIIFFIIPVQLPFFLKSIQVEKNALIGFAIATNTIFAAISSAFYSRIKKRWSYPKILVIGFFLMSIGYLIVFLAGRLMIVEIGLVCSGLGIGMIIPSTTLWLMDLTPQESRGRAMGKLNTYRFFGQFLSPIIILPITILFDISFTFLIGSVLLILLSVAFIILVKTIKSIS